MKRFFILVLILLFSMTLLARGPLTFEQRVKAQEAIEKVYYNHRIWPKENKAPKPAFEKMVSKETIEAKVTDYLKKSAALEKFWYRAITGEQLQAEMDRVAKGTKDPATLNELFEALNNDPYLIAECLARPVLADRLVRNWYANDERFHRETREKAEEALKTLTPENFCGYSEGQYSKVTYRLEIEGREETERPGNEDHSIGLDEAEFEKMYREIADQGKISGVIEKDDCFLILQTVEKNEGEITVEGMTFKKISVEEWLKNHKEVETLSETKAELSMQLPPVRESECAEGWDNGILDDVPEPRSGHTAVWTGSEMIVWGGDSGYSYVNSGGKYDPSTDTWISTSVGLNCPSPRYSHSAVWTGTEMIIWGGAGNGTGEYYNSGGRYNPSTDSWVATSTGTSCPPARENHTAVWTGTEMIIWGGGYSNTGGCYNPSTDSWVATSTGTSCPSARENHTAVWTGAEMIIWGGAYGSGFFNTGGRYNPSTNTWNTTSIGVNCPSGRWNQAAVWTGSEMIIWGGWSNSQCLNTGGKYNPATDTWNPTSAETNCPSPRYGHAAVWTGSEMIVWGGWDWSIGVQKTGGRYNPSTDIWRQTSATGTPHERAFQTAIWTGSEMIVWGGWFYDGENYSFNDGGRYNPLADTWVPISEKGPPSQRRRHSTTWTGVEMIIWGGDFLSYFNTGGKYNPTTDSWREITTIGTPSERTLHTAIWTGSEMIIWGGFYWDGNEYYLNTGGRYNPSTDAWLLTSVGTNCPSGRYGHTGVWTGSEMIIWGGYMDISPWHTNTGGRYNPQKDTWIQTSTSEICPFPRSGHTAVWTGTEMIIYGGNYQEFPLGSGGRYNPISDSWCSLPNSDAVWARECHTAIWTGSEMVVWGGKFNGQWWDTGGRYNPVSDQWITTDTSESPSGRYGHSAVWTGTEMIIWGGYGYWEETSTYLNNGGIYNPLRDSWSETTTYNAPFSRESHTAIWTGSQMIIWGGNTEYIYFNSGGRYHPGTFTQPSISGSASNPCPSQSVSISVPASYTTYQWNLNGSPISGANLATFAATSSGSYTVSVTDSNGCSGTSDPYVVTITPCIPNIVYSSHGSFSEITGDGDSFFERGEKWSVPVTVTNSGNTPATNVIATLSGNGITVCNSPASFETIAAGGTATVTLEFLISSSFTPCGGDINFNLGSKSCSELTPAGADETNLFSIQVGQIAAGVPTDLVIQPSTADSYVYQLSSGTNYGTATTMLVQARTAQARRSLVQFDISPIPEGSTVNSATLELYATNVTGGLTLNVHRITGTWTETGVTWTNQPAFTSTADASITGGTSTGWKIWDVASVVQQWVGGTATNYGFVVKAGTETGLSAVTNTFASKENATSSFWPVLRINYTPPTSVNCDYVGSGICSVPLPGEAAPGDTYENGQMWSGTAQSWPALTGAAGYKLYRGVQSGLQYLLTADNDSCLRYEGAATSIDLSSDDPSGDAARLYWYIVTGTNGSGEGPAGSGRIVNSSGNCE